MVDGGASHDEFAAVVVLEAEWLVEGRAGHSVRGLGRPLDMSCRLRWCVERKMGSRDVRGGLGTPNFLARQIMAAITFLHDGGLCFFRIHPDLSSRRRVGHGHKLAASSRQWRSLSVRRHASTLPFTDGAVMRVSPSSIASTLRGD